MTQPAVQATLQCRGELVKSIKKFVKYGRLILEEIELFENASNLRLANDPRLAMRWIRLSGHVTNFRKWVLRCLDTA